MSSAGLPKRISISLGIVALIVISASCKGKKSTPPPATPTPAPTSPPPIMTTPTPTAQDVNIPGCIPGSIPAAAVSVIRSGGCPTGFKSVDWSDGTKVCMANSACREANRENFRCWRGDYPEIGWDCHPVPQGTEYEASHSHGIVLDKQLGMFYDEGRGYSDAYGRIYMNPRSSSADHDWYWGGGCPPRMCITREVPRCSPTSPPLARLEMENMGAAGEGGRILVDVTPIVCNGPPGSGFENYCQTHSENVVNGCCPVRKASDPQREQCERDLIGKNPYTGKIELQFDGHWWRTNNIFQFVMAAPSGLSICSNPYPPMGGTTVVCNGIDQPE